MERTDRPDYEHRNYRSLHTAADLQYFHVGIKESDLAIGVDKESYIDSLVPFCREELIKIRETIEKYICRQPEFKTALVPLDLLPGAEEIIKQMGRAARETGVGPMAAVAGAVSEWVGCKLAASCREIIVENGGDLYVQSSRPRTIAVFAGQSRFSYKVGIQIEGEETPLGVCTSSGTVGPSLSFGRADAVVIKGKTGALADAAATAAANRIQTVDDLLKAVEFVQKIPGITGILAIKDDKMAAWGKMEIVPITRRQD